MKIDDSCTCGARATFEDERSSYINNGGKPDEQGLIFQVEKIHARWLDEHKPCRVFSKK